MKLLGLIALAAVCVAPLMAGYPGAVLFSDNYNRPNNTDIDASSVGMAGTLAPQVYVEAFEGSGVATSTQILNNLLNVAMGPGMGSLFIDHNLTDAAILSADGFSVSLDVVTITTADDIANRFGGFGVGNTRDEGVNARDSFDSLVPFRPNIARANTGIGVSDFYVDLALDMNLRIWSKGNLLETIAVGAAAGTIRADFYVTDFNAGSAVIADVYFNGVRRATHSFTWDNTNANYLGISGRTAAAGVLLDNLFVQELYCEKANTPVPVMNEISVDPATVVLQWNKGKDAAGNPNANIARHYLYIVEGEPNFVGITPITVANAADPISHNPASIDAFDTDKTFYWRVDESVLVNGNPSLPAEPNTITGFVWSFETIKSVPVITAQPANQLAEIAQPAALTISVSSLSPVSYAWYKTTDNVNNTAADDVLVGSAQNLTFASAQVSDESYYYCMLVNDSGQASATYSNVVSLGVKRQVARWTLNAADYTGGFYQDISGNAHHAEPNLVPMAGSFVPGVDPAETAEALDTTVVPLSVADSGDWAAAAFTSQITVSAWLKWAGPNGAWQGIVSNRVDPTNGNFFIEIRQDNGNVQIGSPGGTDLIAGNLPIGQWTHVVVTASAAGRNIYMNGLPVITRSPANPITQLVVPMYFGALGRSAAGTLTSPFNGVIDDVQIFNYAKSGLEVADLYYDVSEMPVCINPTGVDLQFDTAGAGPSGDEPDCRVDLKDLAAFAADWLLCGLYPQSDC